MKTLRRKFMRLRLSMSKKAKRRYMELQEQQRLIDISLKAREHHEREQEAIEFVSKKAAKHDRTMKVVVTTEGAKRHGDEVLLTSKLVPMDAPRPTRKPSTMSGFIQVEEAGIPEDKFQYMLDKRHANIKKNVDLEYKRRESATATPVAPTTTSIDPNDALHFMMTGKIPVRSQDELEAIRADGFQVEEVEITGDDAEAMLYLTGRNNRK
jgi:hypothetical protein